MSNIDLIKIWISVIMMKNIQITLIQSMIIIRLQLVISKTRFSLLVDHLMIRKQRTPKLSYLILAQINGRQKLHFHSLRLSEFTFWLHLITCFSICCYGTISRQASVLIIGGRIDGSDSSLIAKYTVDQWERIGNLQDSRGWWHGISVLLNIPLKFKYLLAS